MEQNNEQRYIIDEESGRVVSIEEANENLRKQKLALKVKIAALCMAIGFGASGVYNYNFGKTDEVLTEMSSIEIDENIIQERSEKLTKALPLLVNPIYKDEKKDVYLLEDFSKNEITIGSSFENENLEEWQKVSKFEEYDFKNLATNPNYEKLSIYSKVSIIKEDNKKVYNDTGVYVISSRSLDNIDDCWLKLGSLPEYLDSLIEYNQIMDEYVDGNITEEEALNSISENQNHVIEKVETNNRDDAIKLLVESGLSEEEALKKVSQSEANARVSAGAVSEDQIKQFEANLQSIYDEVYKIYSNGYFGEYNSEWSNASDASIRNTYNYAKQDGQSYLSQKTYADVYNYYNQGGTGEFNSSWANSSNSIIKEAYVKGKNDGIQAYESRKATENKENISELNDFSVLKPDLNIDSSSNLIQDNDTVESKPLRGFELPPEMINGDVNNGLLPTIDINQFNLSDDTNSVEGKVR